MRETKINQDIHFLHQLYEAHLNPVLKWTHEECMKKLEYLDEINFILREEYRRIFVRSKNGQSET